MPDNLTVTIGVDTAKARADLTLLKQDLQALGKELNAAAKAGDVTKVNELSLSYEKMRGQVKLLNQELSRAGTTAAAGTGIKGMIANVEALATSFGGLRTMFAGGAIGLAVKEAFDFINESLNETSQRLTDIKKASDATGLKPVQVQAFTELAKEARSAVDPLLILTKTMQLFGDAAIKAGDVDTVNRGVRTLRGLGDVTKAVNGDMVRMKGSFSGAAAGVETYRGSLRQAIDLSKPLETLLKGQQIMFPKTPEGEVAKLKAIATAFIEMHKNRPDLADALGVAMYAKRFAELESVLKAIAEGKLDEKVKELAGAARGTTPELQALNDRLKQSYDELSKAQEDAAALSLRRWAPVKIFFTDLFTQILKGSNEGPAQWDASLKMMSENLQKNPPAFMKPDFFDTVLAGIRQIPAEFAKSLETMSAMPLPAFFTAAFWTDLGARIVSTFNAASAAVSSALSQTPGGGLPAVPFASGGLIRGSGSGTSDSILARLSNGEFVMRAAAVDRWGTGVMQRLNSLQNPFGFSGGGLVRSVPRFAGGGMVTATTSDGVTVNLHFPGGSFEMRGDKGIVAGLTREARRAGMLSAGRMPGALA